MKKGREVELWEDVTPEMMSEEEEDGEGYVRHPPSYRSEGLTKFITKLDQRLDMRQSKHPRVARRLDSPLEKPLPHMYKKWVVKKELRGEHGQREYEQYTSDDEESKIEGETNTSNNSENVY